MTEEADPLESLPVDTAPSRIRDRGPVTGFIPDDDPDDVATVDEKVAEFRRLYPDGVIRTKATESNDFDGRTYSVSARVKRVAGGYTVATGHAARTQGVGDEPFASRALETAESVAISRALRFLGITGANHENPPAEA